MKYMYFFIWCFISLSANADFSESCPRQSIPNTCVFYDKCLEEKNECGLQGYPIDYGLKYCNEFNSMELSKEGKKWIEQTMLCLQNELVPYAQTKTSCGTIKNEAFNSHVTCYVNSGFCKLPLKDKAIISVKNLWVTVTTEAGAKQAIETLFSCIDK